MLNVTLWLALLAGFVSFISPCVLPLVPAYIGYMSNRATAHALAYESATTTPTPLVQFQLVLHGVMFVLGFSFVFVTFGLAATAGTRLLATGSYDIQHIIIPRLGGVLIILFGLHFIDVLVPTFYWLERRPIWSRLGALGQLIQVALSRLQLLLYADTRPRLQSNHASGLLGSGIMGVIFSAGWTPCIGPIYGTILTLAASGTDMARSAQLLLVYSLGLGLPFILTAALLSQMQGLLHRLKRYLNICKIGSGLLMIAVGLLIYTGNLQRLSALGANSTLAYNLEECATQLTQAGLPITDLADCLTQQP